MKPFANITNTEENMKISAIDYHPKLWAFADRNFLVPKAQDVFDPQFLFSFFCKFDQIIIF